VETETGYIWEPESGAFMKKAYFYERAKPRVEARYTAEEAAIMATRTKNLGPWTEQERCQYLKKKSPAVMATVECPICKKEIRISEYDKVTRSQALIKHLEAEHPIGHQSNPQRPTRDDVEIGTWVERDRIGIWLTDKRTDKTIAEWWDESAREMFEQGWFKPGDIRHQKITGRAFEESVLDYAERVGLLAGGSNPSKPFSPETNPTNVKAWERTALAWQNVPKYERRLLAEKAGLTTRKGQMAWGALFQAEREAIASVWSPTEKVRFIGSCKVVNGLCHTHGYSVSREVKCPDSELTKEEWAAAWELAHEAFPEGQRNPWVNGWWPGSLEEAERTILRYEKGIRNALRKYEAMTREAVDRYRRSAEKAIYNYRRYVMREYERGKAVAV
jgi:hypothetical protein